MQNMSAKNTHYKRWGFVPPVQFLKRFVETFPKLKWCSHGATLNIFKYDAPEEVRPETHI